MAKFEIFVDRAGQYRWHLRANNNEIVAASESYLAKQSAINSADLVRRLAPTALIEDLTSKRYL